MYTLKGMAPENVCRTYSCKIRMSVEMHLLKTKSSCALQMDPSSRSSTSWQTSSHRPRLVVSRSTCPPFPPPPLPREQLCNRYCSNKHTREQLYNRYCSNKHTHPPKIHLRVTAVTPKPSVRIGLVRIERGCHDTPVEDSGSRPMGEQATK